MDGNFQAAVTHRAQADFERARRKAFFNDLISALRRESNWLLSFEEVRDKLPMQGQHYRGIQQVPISAIVGSVDRYHDFDRKFLPTQTHTRPRWESVDIAALTYVDLPPVQLYKVGDVYFVKDGNHRVSVAREKGVEFIDAEVVEHAITVPLTLAKSGDARDLLRLGEYARFLEQTKLDKLRPDVCIEFTSLGRYDVLLEHISAHRWYMGIEQNRPIEWQEAVVHWYDHVYMPVVKAIEENGILQDFPGRTPGDLYLWIIEHKWYLHEESGEDIGPQTAALRYDERYAPWTRKVVRSLRRLRQATTKPLIVSARRTARALRASQPEAEIVELPPTRAR